MVHHLRQQGTEPDNSWGLVSNSMPLIKNHGKFYQDFYFKTIYTAEIVLIFTIDHNVGISSGSISFSIIYLFFKLPGNHFIW